uniref:Uncharacterized protein n=1 Tax=Rubinisphaera brasiliensis (strain ATCC 49424 / DSM 5305 / JCM 21570 / IAM 15109 / NBRC 103401 / IFAM 1448) TaxID=756272 RepID=F0SRV8_RUBBR|nr:hypothetical protein Plabr_2674 [Rubinisphaera brasiliensis DSM 5305]
MAFHLGNELRDEISFDKGNLQIRGLCGRRVDAAVHFTRLNCQYPGEDPFVMSRIRMERHEDRIYDWRSGQDL